MNRMKGVTRIDAVEQIAGHEGYLDRNYRMLDEEELIKAYKQGMSTVTIFNIIPDLSGVHNEITNLRDENRRLRDHLQDFELEMKKIIKTNPDKIFTHFTRQAWEEMKMTQEEMLSSGTKYRRIVKDGIITVEPMKE